MRKIAMVKQAELLGVAAALNDAGLVKFASEVDMYNVASIAASDMGVDYDVDEAIEKIAEVAEFYEASLQKIAEIHLYNGYHPSEVNDIITMIKLAVKKNPEKVVKIIEPYLGEVIPHEVKKEPLVTSNAKGKLKTLQKNFNPEVAYTPKEMQALKEQVHGIPLKERLSRSWKFLTSKKGKPYLYGGLGGLAGLGAVGAGAYFLGKNNKDR